MSAQKRLVESIPCDTIPDITHIDVEVYYAKDSYTTRPRGYYLSVKPVKREAFTITHNLFSGTSKLLMETSRFSAKQFEKAVELGRSAAPELVYQVIKKETAA